MSEVRHITRMSAPVGSRVKAIVNRMQKSEAAKEDTWLVSAEATVQGWDSEYVILDVDGDYPGKGWTPQLWALVGASPAAPKERKAK